MILYGVLLVLGLPLIEIALFVGFGDALGVLGTLLIVIATAVLGVFLLTQYSLFSLARNPQTLMQAALDGPDAVNTLLHSALLAMAGILLILPGFFTDTLGGLLLIPPLRAAVGRRLLARAQRMDPQDIMAQMSKMPRGRNGRNIPSDKKSDIIDGEYSRDD